MKINKNSFKEYLLDKMNKNKEICEILESRIEDNAVCDNDIQDSYMFALGEKQTLNYIYSHLSKQND